MSDRTCARPERRSRVGWLRPVAVFTSAIAISAASGGVAAAESIDRKPAVAAAAQGVSGLSASGAHATTASARVSVSVTARCAAQGYGTRISSAGTPIGCDYSNFVANKNRRGVTRGCVIGTVGLIAGVVLFPGPALGARVVYSVSVGSSAYGVLTAC